MEIEDTTVSFCNFLTFKTEMIMNDDWKSSPVNAFFSLVHCSLLQKKKDKLKGKRGKIKENKKQKTNENQDGRVINGNRRFGIKLSWIYWIQWTNAESSFFLGWRHSIFITTVSS